MKDRFPVQGKIDIDIAVREDGHSHIIIEGHAHPIVCAMISGIIQTAALGIRALALYHPEHFTWFQWVWPRDNMQVKAPDAAVVHTKRPGDSESL